jgi:hypothetical protein
MGKTWEEVANANDRRAHRAFVLAGVVLTMGILGAAMLAATPL